MDNPFNWKTIERDGEKMHEGVAALIEVNGKYLLQLRRFPPFGYGLVGGHVDKSETNEQALTREIAEEIQVHAKNFKYIFSVQEQSKQHFFRHYCHVYRCEIEGEPRVNFESKSVGWFEQSELANLQLTETTRQIFQKLGLMLK